VRLRGDGKDGEVPEYLTVREACAIARISRTTFYKLLDDPRSGLAETVIRIPGFARLRIPESSFRSWLEGFQSAKKPRLRACFAPETR
jgi:excisionase family DNA binding protein